MSLSQLAAISEKVQSELKLLDNRIQKTQSVLGSNITNNNNTRSKSAGAAAAEKEEQEVLRQLGQLYQIFNSRSSSVATNVASSSSVDPYYSSGPQAANSTPTARSGTPPPPNAATAAAGGFATRSPENNSPASSRSGSAYQQQQQQMMATSSSPHRTPMGSPKENSSSSPKMPQAPPPPAKTGNLLNYGFPSIMRSFKTTFVLIDTDVVKWWKSEDEFSGGKNPTGTVPLFKVQSNSRQSVIKQTAACWPWITKEDCPKATDPSKHYFGVQYFDDKNNLQHLVLAASTLEEKKQWVTHLSLLIPMHLPPDAPSLPQGELFIQMATSANPYHTKTVLSGEAPK